MTPVLTPMMAAAAGLAVLSVIQIALLWKLARATRVTADATDRVAQLTSALALLTDTTEEGFVNVASELERLGAKPLASGATRRAITRRIAGARRKGLSIEDIAAAEALSESEVRLHLGLEASAAPATPREAELTASEAPGVLDDIERWMHSLSNKARRSRGGRHAVVRV
jgi:hypothetical protein